jgi:hypothetical protein
VKKKALLIAAPFRSGLAFNLVEGPEASGRFV